jgi:DNA (cytosine-5)-methyltransferase 1
MVYYNEIDPYAAQWLRNLIAAGHIASGVVDERSICNVDSADLADFTQCHFFAGIGVWSLALRRAGWPDDRPVWTGSCPCQPFSAAGKRDGFSDERHLWPHLFRLIAQRRPAVVFGEQVASRDGLEWLDLVQADLEGADYASAAVDICAAGVGAPHIRQRLYWAADADDARLEGRFAVRQRADECAAGPHGVADGLADASNERHERCSGDGREAQRRVEHAGELGGLADASQRRHGEHERNPGTMGGAREGDESQEPKLRRVTQATGHSGEDCGARPTNGHWRDADWLHCRDGKWRPVEPGTFPLAHGAPARVGRLRAYGNAIVPQVAEAVIRAYMQ